MSGGQGRNLELRRVTDVRLLFENVSADTRLGQKIDNHLPFLFFLVGFSSWHSALWATTDSIFFYPYGIGGCTAPVANSIKRNCGKMVRHAIGCSLTLDYIYAIKQTGFINNL